MKFAIGLALLIAPAPLHAGSLTIRTGETWMFRIERGQPARPRRVPPSARPASSEIKVSVRRLAGTSLIATNNSPVRYTFRAELLAGGKAVTVRTCTLPANGLPALESWSQRADAVRLSNFRATDRSGSCP